MDGKVKHEMRRREYEYIISPRPGKYYQTDTVIKAVDHMDLEIRRKFTAIVRRQFPAIHAPPLIGGLDRQTPVRS